MAVIKNINVNVFILAYFNILLAKNAKKNVEIAPNKIESQFVLL